MPQIRFNSIEEFYDFIDDLSTQLNELGFSDTSQRLNTILHATAWTSSSEMLGEIKISLVELTTKEGRRLPECLSNDVNLCIRTIDEYWNQANR